MANDRKRARVRKVPGLADGTEPGTEPSPFAGIDRGVNPVSLQHMATPRPLTRELLREGLAEVARREGWTMDPAPPAGELARLEVRTAERDRALDLVAQLERIITATGGYMSPEDQAWLREAQSLLVEHGRRAPEQRAVWVDRVL